MHGTLDFLMRHGYLVLIGWVFAEQAGMPIPSAPILLAAGALAGSGRMNLMTSLILCVVAATAADSIWYELGRRQGLRILHLLCRISLEPDSCVRRTEGVFEKQGARSLLFSKFVPGLSTVATPLAGIFDMRPHRFLLFDAAGSVLWAGSFLLLGFVFTDQIEHVAARAALLGGWLLVLLVGGLAAYIGYKFLARRRFLTELRIARISPAELKQKLDAKEDLVVVDLRHSLDFEADPETIPGAVRMDAKTLDEDDRIPRDRQVVLYCT